MKLNKSKLRKMVYFQEHVMSLFGGDQNQCLCGLNPASDKMLEFLEAIREAGVDPEAVLENREFIACDPDEFRIEVDAGDGYGSFGRCCASRERLVIVVQSLIPD